MSMMTEQQVIDAPSDQYMDEAMLAFFQQLLEQQKQDLIDELEQDKHNIAIAEHNPDVADMASNEENTFLNLRHLERRTKLLHKIEEALERIDDGSYGYCEVNGEPIGVQRLLIRPTATMSIEAKERQEHFERIDGDD